MSLSSAQAQPTKDGLGEEKEEPEKLSPLKNPLVRLVVIAVGIILLILFVLRFSHYWTRGRFAQETDDAYLQADQVSVSTRVSAFVDAVYVTDHQSVTPGQPLVRLNPRDPAARAWTLRTSRAL